jgi:hypothetical protein
MRRLLACVGSVGAACTLVLAQGCSSTTTAATPPPPPVDAGPPPPPRVCKQPPTTPPKWFSDGTAAAGLAKTTTLQPVSGALAAADLDGDGFSDLVAMAITSHRVSTDPNWAGKQIRFLFMNQPDPNDATHRVYVDTLKDSGLLSTRDGMGNRGFGLADFGDLDDDGDIDAILCPTDEITPPNAPPEDACDAMLNDGKGHFTLAPSSDLNSKTFWVPGAALLDYDRDGFLDFWPSTVAHWPYNPNDPSTGATLFRGNGDGTFSNVSAAVGLPTHDGSLTTDTQWRHVFGNTACDIDNDGDDDMILASYGREENWVFRNDNGHFTEVGQALGIAHDDRVDTSDDQSFRCYCAANPTDKTCTPMPPAPVVKCNDAFGAGSGPYFRGWQPGVTDQPWSLGGNNFSIACGDIDDDGDMDLMTATIVHGDVGSSADPSELVINPGDGTKFTRPGNVAMGLDRPETGVYWNHGETMAVMVDIDLDGRKDILITETGAYGYDNTAALFHQKADGTFEEVDQPAGLINTVIRNINIPTFVDVDGDGDLDLVTSLGADPSMHVFQNDVGQAQNLVRVHLDGGAGTNVNRSGIGAIVKVTAGGRTQTQYVSGGYGHGNVQNDMVLTFGLGSACDIDKIDVRWPDGSATVSTFPNVRANYDVTLTFGSPSVAYGTIQY